jgi:hypothetical protein
MKTQFFAMQIALMSVAFGACGQGSLQYDQQSVPSDAVNEGNPIVIQTNIPIGQSFTPTLSSVGFVALAFRDANPGNNLGATIYVNLRQDSITGTILGSTEPLFMPNGIADSSTNFFFSSPVSVTPGTTYYLEPVVQSGDIFDIYYYNFGYSGGTAFFNGAAASFEDLWFREGTVVPEPSSALLISIGAGALVYVHRRLNGKRRA